MSVQPTQIVTVIVVKKLRIKLPRTSVCIAEMKWSTQKLVEISVNTCLITTSSVMYLSKFVHRSISWPHAHATFRSTLSYVTQYSQVHGNRRYSIAAERNSGTDRTPNRYNR